MFELTNEQRKYFALPPVLDSWKKIKIKPGPYDRYSTYVYLDDTKIMKVILCSDEPEIELYREFSVNETLSDDKTKILPKTDKGNPKNLTAPNLEKKTPVGMSLNFGRGSISLTNNSTKQAFYCSVYEGVEPKTWAEFKSWIENWCTTMTNTELARIREFAKKKLIHHNFSEGDFFRYRITKSLYGYGRFLLNFDKMRKKNIPFWDMFMGKPVCAGVYHIATEDPNITPQQLVGKMMLPPITMMDNIFFYGECEIIGNIPLKDNEADFPIHYGRSICMLNPEAINYQCGKVFVSLKDGVELYPNFRYGGVGFNLNVELPVLKACIRTNSNDPYWEMMPPYFKEEDLRNPKFHKELNDIKKQIFG